MTDDEFPIWLSVVGTKVVCFELKKHIKIPCIPWSVMRQVVPWVMYDDSYCLLRTQEFQKQIRI